MKRCLLLFSLLFLVSCSHISGGETYNKFGEFTQKIKVCEEVEVINYEYDRKEKVEVCGKPYPQQFLEIRW